MKSTSSSMTCLRAREGEWRWSGEDDGGSERGRVLPRALCALTSSSSKDTGKE